MSGEHTFGASDDIVRRIRENLPHIEWEQPLSAERERLAADAIEELQVEVERLRAKRDAEHDLADQLASHLEWALRCVGSLPLEMRATFDARMAEVLAAHKEARRA